MATEVSPPTTDECSTNFYWTVGNAQIFNLQTTLRGQVDPEAVKLHLAGVMDSLKALVTMGGHAKAVGRQPDAPNAAAPAIPEAGAPVPPPPAPANGGASNGRTDSPCAMIEVATSYTGGKTQLKFHVDGMEHPLTFTKEVKEMAQLLAPLGYTAGHIVVGKKYPTNCIVTWVQAEKYRNVMAVRPA